MFKLFILSAFLVVNLGMVNIASAEVFTDKDADLRYSSQFFSSLQKQIQAIQGSESQNIAGYHEVSEDLEKHNSACECKPADKDCHCPKEEHHFVR